MGQSLVLFRDRPLRWILAHARTMQRVLHTGTLLKEFRDRRDVARLREMRQIWKDGPFALRGELRDESFLYRTSLRQATEQWGLFAIDEFLGGNIRGLYPRVVFAVDGNTSIDFGFSTFSFCRTSLTRKSEFARRATRYSAPVIRGRSTVPSSAATSLGRGILGGRKPLEPRKLGKHGPKRSATPI
jgi:hypothetical protein